MNITQSIAHAACGEHRSILGLRMRPLSAGHWLLLHRADVAFVTDRQPMLADLLMGLLICSQEYDALTDHQLEPRELERLMRIWQRRLSGGWRGKLARRWRKMRGLTIRPSEVVGFEFGPTCDRFSQYLEDHGVLGLPADVLNCWAFPLTVCQRANTEPVEINCPEPWLLVTAAMADFGMGLKDALKAPLAMLRWLLAAKRERKGEITVLDREEELAEQRRADAFAKEVADGRMV